MATGLDSSPSATTFTLEELVNRAWNGQIRVPHFQRDFRWSQRDVIRLFDSIVKGYPIGSLLMWLRPARKELVRLGSMSIEAQEASQALWVVDGQQRIVSLANALSDNRPPDERFDLAYDLRDKEFVPLPTRSEPHIVPLPVIFDLTRLIRWFAENSEVSDRLDQASRLTTVIRQFSVPAYQVDKGDATVLQDIFDRMNNYGKRLSRAEVFSALFAGSEEDSESTLTLDLISQHVSDATGFGLIDSDTVLRAVLARRGPNPSREIRVEFSESSRREAVEFPSEGRDEAFRLGEEALLRSVRFLKEEAGVPHFSLLAYRYLLVVLARVFGHFPNPDERNLQLLRRWYWSAAVVGPEIFKGSATGAMRALCVKVRRGDLTGSIQGLIEAVDRPHTQLPDIKKFRTNTGSAKLTLCAWWDSHPRSLITGDTFDHAVISEFLADRGTAAEAVPYIIGRSGLPEKYRMWAANRLLLPTEEVPASELVNLISNRPIQIDETVWINVLRSHQLDESMSNLLGSGHVIEFLEARQEMLEARLKTFLQRRCEWGFENTPPLDEFEIEDLYGSDPDDTAFIDQSNGEGE
ncbi:DUF262 domain-containing protein [Streptomyces venezuelae ATCC 10712]